MRLSRRARYALRMMLAFARLTPEEGRVSLQRISTHTGISYRFLEQLALALRQHGLLSGLAGKNGGYVLGKPPEEIRLDEIVEAAIGPIIIVECLANPRACTQIENCECRKVYQEINQSIKKILGSYSLLDLLHRHKKR